MKIFIILLFFISKITYASSFETIESVVGNCGHTGFYLNNDPDNTTKYWVAVKTNYTPIDWRAVKGDKVSFEFYKKITKKDNSFKNIITKLTLIELSKDRIEIDNPVIAIATNVGKKWIDFNLLGSDNIIKFEKNNSTKYYPKNWNPKKNETVKVYFQKVVNRFGNSYVYLINKLEKEIPKEIY